MNIIKKITLCAVALATTNVVAHEQTKISYGNISSVLITTPDSEVLQSAIIGGVVGVALGEGVKGALDGAAASYAITSAFEGDRRVFLYTVDVKGKPVKVVMQEGGLSEGQCVALETTKKHVNLRSVSTSFCLKPQHKALNGDDVVALQQSQAKACDKARHDALTAKSDDEIDHAMTKVRALCE